MKTSMKLLSIVAALGLFGGYAQADEAALLTKLVKKGVLTNAEAQELAGDTGVVAFSAKGKHTKKVRINGRLQFQWNALKSDYNRGVPDPASENNMFLRRIFLGVNGDLGEGWSGFINGEWANANAMIEQAWIKYDGFEDVTLQFGKKKAPFGYEENTSSANIKTVERSISNRYFIDQLLGSSYFKGVFASADLMEGIYVKAAVTDPRPGAAPNAGGPTNATGAATGTSNSPAVFGGIGIRGKMDNVGYNIGVNGGLIPDQRTAVNNAQQGMKDLIYGIYGNFQFEQFSLMAELMTADLKKAYFDVNGRAKKADPLGFTIQPSYKWDDEFEIVAAYSHIDADIDRNATGQGTGVNTSTVYRRSNQASNAAGITNNNDFNEMSSWYIGGNWYIMGNDVKLSGGYEWAEADERIATSGNAATKADIQGFRARLQLLF